MRCVGEKAHKGLLVTITITNMENTVRCTVKFLENYIVSLSTR